MSLALAVLVWAIAVAVVLVLATVVVGAVLGLLKLARGPRDVADPTPIHPRWGGDR